MFTLCCIAVSPPEEAPALGEGEERRGEERGGGWEQTLSLHPHAHSERNQSIPLTTRSF